MEREIQKLRQRISEGEDNNRTHSITNDEKTSHNSSPVSHIQSLNTLLPLSDDRYTSESSTSVRSIKRLVSCSFVYVANTSSSFLLFIRINAYIEEEVQRRLRKMNLLNGSSSNMDLSLSCESLRVRTVQQTSFSSYFILTWGFIKVMLIFYNSAYKLAVYTDHHSFSTSRLIQTEN